MFCYDEPEIVGILNPGGHQNPVVGSNTQIPTSQPGVPVSGDLAGEAGALGNLDFNDSSRKPWVCSVEEPVAWQENLNVA